MSARSVNVGSAATVVSATVVNDLKEVSVAGVETASADLASVGTVVRDPTGSRRTQ